MQKFEFLRQPLLGELAMSRKKEREKEQTFFFYPQSYIFGDLKPHAKFREKNKLGLSCAKLRSSLG